MLYLDGLSTFEDFPERIRIDDARELTLSWIKNELTRRLSKTGIPVSVENEQVQSGGLFRKQYEDCLCISNPEHLRDYFKFCIRLQKTGNIAFILVNYTGSSSLTERYNISEEYKERGTFTGRIIGSIGRVNQQAFDAEYNYYNVIKTTLGEMLGI